MSNAHSASPTAVNTASLLGAPMGILIRHKRRSVSLFQQVVASISRLLLNALKTKEANSFPTGTSGLRQSTPATDHLATQSNHSFPTQLPIQRPCV